MPAKDIKVRPIVIHLDKPRTLVFDLNAFEELEQLYGTVENAFEAFQSQKSPIKDLKNFLFAGLVHEDETLTPKAVGKMIGYNNINEITDRVYQAMSGALPEKEEGSESTEGEA